MYPKRPTWSHSEPRNLQKHNLRNRVEKVRKKDVQIVSLGEPFSIEIYKDTIPKTIIKNIDFEAKGVPKWKHIIDSKSDQKSMPKQVAKQIMQIIKSQAFLMCQNM